MNLYQLGHVPWLDSQLIYHSLPRVGEEGLILLAPADPYVCIGYHQDAGQEVDLSYCRQQNIPVFRREVGGGAVFLDGSQVFYQLVLHRDNPLTHGSKLAFYERLLAPVVQTYRDLGVDAEYRPVNDIVTVGGRKISGNGAAEIGDYRILVGNVIVDFDYDTMVRVLRVPDEKFRDKVHKSMRANLTTLRRETGDAPSLAQVSAILARRFAEVLGPLAPADVPPHVMDAARALAATHTTEEWLLQPGRRVSRRRDASVSRDVKIAGSVNVVQGVHKAPGGLIRATVEVHDGLIANAGLSGDFFFYPADGLADLESYLIGTRLDDLPETIRAFYAMHGVESPGVQPEHLAAAFGSTGGQG